MNPANRIDSLTGIRFFAALIVVFEHYQLSSAVLNWAYGVGFFFVLSGFILTYVARNIDRDRGYFEFFWARVARIWPLHILMLYIYVRIVGYYYNDFFYYHFFAVQAFIPTEDSYWNYNYPSWSISVEFAFYALFPLLIYKWEKTLWWKAAFALAVSAALLAYVKLAGVPYYDESKPSLVNSAGILYINPFARLPEFILGMLAYTVCSKISASYNSKSLLWTNIVEFIAAGLVVACFCRLSDKAVAGNVSPDVRDWIVQYVNSIVAAIFVAVLFFNRGIVSKFLALKPIVVLGEASFALYMTHAFYRNVFEDRHILGGHFDRSVGWICLAIAIPMSILVHRFYEVPMRKLFNKLPRYVSSSTRSIAGRLWKGVPVEQPAIPLTTASGGSDA